MENLDLKIILSEILKIINKKRQLDTLDSFKNRMEMAENTVTLNIDQ